MSSEKSPLINTSDDDFSVGIVGAGISGITLGIRLKAIGFHNFTIYERDVDVGGTWQTNFYPGCRCDVNTHLYSLSTHLNPNWTETHVPQPEILAYWKKLAKEEGIYPHCQFLTSFLSASWDASTNSYNLSLRSTLPNSTFASYAPESTRRALEEEKFFERRHNILVSGTGGFSWPLIPNIPGLKNPYIHDGQPQSLFSVEKQFDEKFITPKTSHQSTENGDALASDTPPAEAFEGMVIHPSRWPRGGVDLKGKTIAVLGNGCSGTQIVTAVSEDKEVKILNFMRSGQWFLPRPQHSYSKLMLFLFRYLPGFMWLYRYRIYWMQEMFWYLFELPHTTARGLAEAESVKHVRKNAPKDVQDTLIPTYPFGGTRTVFDVGYINALNKDNVQAITSKIQKLTKDSIVTADGKSHEVDIVVVATGYDVTAAVLDVRGKEGVRIIDALKDDGPLQYRGMMYTGLPNFFAMLGHNTAPGHTSVIVNIEAQANYITQCIAAMRDEKIKTLEPKVEAAKAYNKWLDIRLDNSTFSQATSFYRLGKNRDGKVFTNWPTYTTKYVWQNRKPKWEELKGGEKLAIKARLGRATTIRRLVVGILALITFLYLRKKR